MSTVMSARLQPATAFAATSRSRVAAVAPRARVRSVASRSTKLAVSACVQERINGTEFWRAEQVKCVATRSHAVSRRGLRVRARGQRWRACAGIG
jgi:hypothetical protein